MSFKSKIYATKNLTKYLNREQQPGPEDISRRFQPSRISPAFPAAAVTFLHVRMNAPLSWEAILAHSAQQSARRERESERNYISGERDVAN